MPERNKKLKVNPIIEAVKAKSEGRIQHLTGYLSEGAAGKLELLRAAEKSRRCGAYFAI